LKPLSPTSLLACLALALPACSGNPPAQPDAGAAVDASTGPDAEVPCTADISQTYYADFDGDGYGSPDLTAVDCSPPERFVDNDLDCDDADSRNNPDGTELCDGLDNDCNADTVEVCGNACSPQPGPVNVYLFCATGLNFAAAEAACEAEGMHLIKVDDQAEQTYLSDQRITAFGGRSRVWNGGNDIATDDTWVWYDDTNFWQGRANGAPVGGLYTRWRAGEPNNGNGIEDCATVDDNVAGTWDDRPCTQVHRFVCEREAETI
jgi:hypothetical protein